MNTAAYLGLAAVVVAALANWHSRYHNLPTVEAITKPLVTILVIVLAHLPQSPHSAARTLVVFGLGFCLIGDVLLMPAIDKFVGGLAAFLVGHILFGVAALTLPDRRWVLVIPAVVVTAAVVWLWGRQIVAGARSKDPKMGIAVSAYLVVISLMAIMVVPTWRWLAMVGAAFFVASDTLLGYDLFVRPIRLAKVGIMMTYHVALVGLTLGLILR